VKPNIPRRLFKGPCGGSLCIWFNARIRSSVQIVDHCRDSFRIVIRQIYHARIRLLGYNQWISLRQGRMSHLEWTIAGLCEKRRPRAHDDFVDKVLVGAALDCQVRVDTTLCAAPGQRLGMRFLKRELTIAGSPVELQLLCHQASSWVDAMYSSRNEILSIGV
jgi:hypothetical protein